MAGRIHVIDANVRRRAQVSRQLHALALHVEIFESVDEFVALKPSEGWAMVADDTEGFLADVLSDFGSVFPIVGYSDDASPEKVVQAMLAGSCGYLKWPFESQCLDIALRQLAGEGVKRIRQRRLFYDAKARVSQLSPREHDVLGGILEGLSSKIIAEMLGISPRTVEIHRRNMMNKLKASNVADAVRIALYAGLDTQLDPPYLLQVA